jgi:hypothetical protein
MRIGEQIRIRAWDKLKFHDPADILRRLRQLEWEIENIRMEQRVRRMRTNLLKKHREARDAALFCHGMGSAVLGTTLFLHCMRPKIMTLLRAMQTVMN